MKLSLLAGALGVLLTFGLSTATAAPISIPLGTITADTFITGSLSSGTVVWYEFTILGASAPTTYFDIHTNNSPSLNDTELGVYDSLGILVANDDDDGISLKSVLTFGAGSGLALGDSHNLGSDGIAEGEDGGLPAGTYYLAVGAFNTTFNSTDFSVTTTASASGLYRIDFLVNSGQAPEVPEPATFLLAGVAAVGLALLRKTGRRG